MLSHDVATWPEDTAECTFLLAAAHEIAERLYDGFRPFYGPLPHGIYEHMHIAARCGEIVVGRLLDGKFRTAPVTAISNAQWRHLFEREDMFVENIGLAVYLRYLAQRRRAA